MDSRKKWTVDSDHEVPLFPEGWAPKAKRVDSDDDAQYSIGGHGIQYQYYSILPILLNFTY